MKTRKSERIRAFLGAQILFNNNNSTVDCQVRNISSLGAKILVSPTVSVPDEFDLLVPQKGRSYRCKLRWRLDEAVGVEFLDGRSRPVGAADELKKRIWELETENQILKQQIAELSRAGNSPEPVGR